MSDEAPKKTKLEELEEKRAKKLEEREAAEAAQYEKDLEARLRLEDDHGTLAAVKVTRHVAGQPTRALVKTPSPVQYKRYKDLIHRSSDDSKHGAKKRQEAIEQLANASWLYPESEAERASMLEAYPGILTPISIAAVHLAEGKSEDEGK